MTDVPRFDMRPEYLEVGRSLAELLTTAFQVRPGARTVIAIAGESGSGKSVTAVCVAHALSAAGLSTALLHQDDYFIRPPRANHYHRVRDLGSVGPHEINLALVHEHIADFRAGAPHVAAPRVDYPGDRFLTQHFDFSGTDTLIVEGTYALGLPGTNVRIFLEATSDDTRERRKLRNRDIDEPIVDRVLDIEHALIAPQAAFAHIIIDREFHLRRPRG